MLLPIMERDPSVQAVTLLRHLQMSDPDRFPDDRIRRTLERRVRDWRALHGAPKDVIFRQAPEPGRMALSDFTDAGELGVTIAGEAFAHRLYHFVLAYSGWEHAALRILPSRRTTAFVEVVARVTRTGGFLVKQVFYSAPARLIGQRLRVHVYDDRVEAWLRATHVVSHPRRRAGKDGRRVYVVDDR